MMEKYIISKLKKRISLFEKRKQKKSFVNMETNPRLWVMCTLKPPRGFLHLLRGYRL
jgi:hypothetical protein